MPNSNFTLQNLMTGFVSVTVSLVGDMDMCGNSSSILKKYDSFRCMLMSVKLSKVFNLIILRRYIGLTWVIFVHASKSMRLSFKT